MHHQHCHVRLAAPIGAQLVSQAGWPGAHCGVQHVTQQWHLQVRFGLWTTRSCPQEQGLWEVDGQLLYLSDRLRGSLVRILGHIKQYIISTAW